MTRETTTRRAVSLFSGGVDSTVLLWWLRAEGWEPVPLSVDYGQRHRVELGAGARILKEAGLKGQLVCLGPTVTALMRGSSQTDPDVAVPRGHYADDTMRATVVPGRNLLLLALAASHAVSIEAEAVAYAAHGGDHPVYPDCRPDFVEAAGRAIRLGNWHQLKLLAPFAGCVPAPQARQPPSTKADIVALGARLGAPLGATWSCYDPVRAAPSGYVHCGLCGTCVERREAFSLAGVVDPTEYALRSAAGGNEHEHTRT